MQRSEPSRGDAGQHRLPHDLVPEAVRRCLEAQHPGGHALVDRLRRSRRAARARGPARPASRRPRRSPARSRACGDSRCTRARTASCTVAGQLPAAGGDHLGDEEGVAAGLAVQRRRRRCPTRPRARRPPPVTAAAPRAAVRPAATRCRRASRATGRTAAGGRRDRSRRRGRGCPRAGGRGSARGRAWTCRPSAGPRSPAPPGPIASSAASAASNSPSRSPERSSSSTCGSSCGATSTSGPSGRGEDSGSQAPQSTGDCVARQMRPTRAPARTSRHRPRRAPAPAVRSRRAPPRADPCSGPEEVVPLHAAPRAQGRSRGRGAWAENAETAGPSIDGSWARISRSSSCSAGPGSMPELVGEGGAGPLVGRERVGLAAGAVLRAHEQRPERLAHRVPAHQRLELGDRRRDTGAPEVGRDAALEGVQPQTRRAARPRPRAARSRRTRRTARPASRLSASASDVAGLVDPAVEQRRAAQRDLALEDQRVDVVRRDVEDVAVPAGADARRAPRGRGAAARRGTAGSPWPRPAARGAPEPVRPAGRRSTSWPGVSASSASSRRGSGPRTSTARPP